MPEKRRGSLQDHHQASRYFDAVFSAWRAVSLPHSERSTLILKRVCDAGCATSAPQQLAEGPAGRRRAAQVCVGAHAQLWLCWTGVSGWGRGVPQD
jgi:hypothetical protein